ncbi:MAG: IS110 family transposase [Sphingobacteriales bacterium]|jgi:transposase|nr:IS110 family transposase [Sphingobacteriales bacterium]
MSRSQKTVTKEVGICYIGADISNKVVDFYYEDEKKGNHKVVSNNYKKLVEYLKMLASKFKIHLVMEATGTYGDALKHALHDNKIMFSVINPVQSKGFMRSQNMTTNNDKQAAKALMQFGQMKQPPCFVMPSVEKEQLKQLLSALNALKKDKRRLENQIHAQNQLLHLNEAIATIWQNRKEQIDAQIKELQTQIDQLANDNYKEMIDNISTIKCVKHTTARAVVAVTGGFANFKNAKEVAKFIGLCPTENRSGSSVRKGSKIPRQGVGQVKALLFNCARSAIRYNPQCKDLYTRLIAKGKNGKVALTAVMHKLLRIIFGVAKSGEKYNPNYIKPKKID